MDRNDDENLDIAMEADAIIPQETAQWRIKPKLLYFPCVKLFGSSAFWGP